jgi:hypothetical protein
MMPGRTLRFYKTAWYLHFQFVGPRIAGPKDDLLVIASALQINRKKAVLGRGPTTSSGERSSASSNHSRSE